MLVRTLKYGLFCALSATLAGCAFVSPRFPQNVQASFARDEMRKMSTRSLDIYYPEQMRAPALRIAARLEGCFERLRNLSKGVRHPARGLIYLTSAEFNNAYVQSDAASLPQQMVMPVQLSSEIFNFYDLGVGDLGDVGCHEAVHYVQMQQVSELWAWLNTYSGGLFQPNIFTESWFLEGLATFYEGRLGAPVGRPHSPLWHGWFESAVQAHETPLQAGYLSPYQRQLEPVGGNYLTGSYFVAYLAKTYGEAKLWELVRVQGASLVSPLGVTLRFKKVYGKSIGALFDDFAKETTKSAQARVRPAPQHTLIKDAGYFARLAVSPADQALATVSVSLDVPVTLSVHERNGALRFSKRLTQLLPERRWLTPHPVGMSGLTFSPDGRWLYVVALDLDKEGSNVSRLWRVDAQNGEVVHIWEDLRGLGGSLTPDGESYVFVQLKAGTANLAKLSLKSGKQERLTHFQGPSSLGAPAVSPDGTRIAFAQWHGAGFDLSVRNAGGQVQRLTQDGRFNYSPHWLDNERLIFLKEEAGRAQAHLMNLTTGKVRVLTDAPHLVLDAAPLGAQRLAFLNREGNHFTVDTVPLVDEEAKEAVAPVVFSAPRPSPPPPELLADQAYSPLDHFFHPELHAPYVYALGEEDDEGNPVLRWVGGLLLAGQDRLGFHAYALSFNINSVDREPNVSLGYANAQLAPWYLQIAGARAYVEGRTDLQLVASASRSFWTTPVAFSLIGLKRQEETLSGFLREAQLVGAEAAFSYSAVEATSYGGAQRALGVSLSTGFYPGAVGTLEDFADIRATVDTAFGALPFLKRDNLQLSLRGRFLPGAPADLLQLGGLSGAAIQWASLPSSGTNRLPVLLPVGIAFSEPLRGYEDHAVRAQYALIGSARYKQRFILDYGWASFLYLLPSFFLREVEVEGFAEMARADFSRSYRSAGAAVRLRTLFGQGVPVSLGYQFAARFDDGLAPLQLVFLSLD